MLNQVDVPIYIVKTPNGLVANNIGPGLPITYSGCDCAECRWYNRYIKFRDIALREL